jgi:cytochrome c-L
LFEILFGGAQGMMGPQYVNFNTDEMLKIMAFIRSIYTGDTSKAKWLK